jgi:hypothetical protein
LAFQRKKLIEKNFSGVGVGLAIHQDNGSRSRAEARYLPARRLQKSLGNRALPWPTDVPNSLIPG